MVDGEGVGRGVEVLRRVDVRAGVIAHAKGVGGAAEDGGAGLLRLVGVPWGDADWGVEGVCGAAVVEFAAEVDEFGFRL